MSLMGMLDRAQGGRLYAAVARSVDLDETQTRKAMAKLCPAIAEQLHNRARQDEELFQSLLDLIADNGAGSPLDDPEQLAGNEALADGHAILDDVFGSRSAAMAALRSADPSVPERELAKLAPLSATAVVAALAQSNTALGLASQPLPAAGAASGQGFFGALIGAIVAGIVAVTLLARRAASSPARHRLILLIVAGLLAACALIAHPGRGVALLLLAAAMGAVNTLFERDGEVAIGLTYMTGTLVRAGQRIAYWLAGEAPASDWLRHLMLWSAFLGGGAAGALLYLRFGLDTLWLATAITLALAIRPPAAA